jgi:hypothetical protein
MPNWSGAPALLAEIIIVLSALTGVSEILGALGLFSRWPFVGTCLVLAAAGRLVGLSPSEAHGSNLNGRMHRRIGSRSSIAIASAASTLVVASWLPGVISSLGGGMREYDTLWYHMPFAARFVQTGWVTVPHYVNNPPDAFLPANSELLHAVGILAFSTDIISPLLNLGWLALVLLAAWCAGHPSGEGPATLAAGAVSLSVPVMILSQAGTAKNDVVALAFLLGAVALLLNGRGEVPAYVLAAIALGLSVGTRVTYLVPALALSVGAVAIRPVPRRILRLWFSALLVAGGFWYVRNALVAGNPLPWFGLSLGPLHLPSTGPTIDCGTSRLVDAIAQGGVLREDIYPFLRFALGSAWPFLLGIAGVGVAAALVREDPPLRMLALVAIIGAVGYAFTPATAGGEEARCFFYNSRFAIPALAIALLLFALVLSRSRAPDWTATALLTLLLAVTVSFPRPRIIAVAAVIMCAGVVFVLAITRLRSSYPIVASAFVITFLLGAVGIGWFVQRDYLQNRYVRGGLPEAVGPAYVLLRKAEPTRVAVAGFFAHYPLYGLNLDNVVEFPVRYNGLTTFRPISSCRGWHEALAEGDYEYVVTVTFEDLVPPENEWTDSYPGSRPVLSGEDSTVFRIEPDGVVITDAGCPAPK